MKSVLQQRYPALQYVVEDGGSTDGSLAIIRRFEPFIATWRSAPDQGQADAINRGFARTSGEIMGWLNSDDVLLPGSLAFVAGYFAAHADVDVVYGDRLLIDEDDKEIGAWILPAHNDSVLADHGLRAARDAVRRRSAWEAAGEPSISSSSTHSTGTCYSASIRQVHASCTSRDSLGRSECTTTRKPSSSRQPDSKRRRRSVSAPTDDP